MAAIDDARTLGRANLNFADERDIDEFVDLLGKFERGELEPDDWRRFRLTRGTYGQRQDGVQMLRVKAPQGIMSSLQARTFADIAAKYSRGFCHLTTRQNMQFHFVLLKNAEPAMREMAAAGLTTREACGNSVRNVTGCPYAGTSASEVFEVAPYAEALTRYFLRHPLAASLPRKFKIAFEGCAEDHAFASINDIGWRARIVDGRRGFRVTVAGGTSIMPVSGYLLYEFLPVEEMLNVAEAVLRVFHRHGDYEHRQRNRLKFTVKTLGWDTFKAKFEEYLAEFKAAGGAPLVISEDALRPVTAPDWLRPTAPSTQAVAAASATPVIGPGIVPGTVRLTIVPDAYARWLRTNVAPQKQAGYHRAPAAGRHYGGSAARARGSGRGLRRRRDAAHAAAEHPVPMGAHRVRRAVLPAADGRGPRHSRRDDAGRRRQLPGRRVLPPGRHAVARARPHADRVPERTS
jgi:sulfite reductase (NADPH) hemoprotein beta-component